MPALIKKHYGWEDSEDYDVAILAGGGGGLVSLDRDGRGQVVLNDFKVVTLGAHHGNEIILLNHQDCGMYAAWMEKKFKSGEEEEERLFHHEELKKEGARARKEFPDPAIKIRLGYVFVNDKDEPDIEDVEFE
ncbi:MAG TPA: hypothetical protein VHF05_02890 [Candidatus Paceibacterota bacterium]|nr:hypothetical protein [Candidatus Paceibacterota bacterium]